MGRRKTQASRKRSSTLIHGMPVSEMLQAFDTLARALHIEVRYDRGDFRSGLCRVGDTHVLVIQKDADPEKKARVFARELGHFDLEGVYVLPALRKMIQEELDQNQPGGEEAN